MPERLALWVAAKLVVTGSSLLLQRKGTSEPAKGVTQAEYWDCIRVIVAAIPNLLKEGFTPEQVARILANLSYSMDNAAVHKWPKDPGFQAPFQPEQRVAVPPWGPDIQQPIEHAHGRFKEAMKKKVRNGWWPKNVAHLLATCEEVWQTVNSKEVVSADVERLGDLYDYLAKESKGGWAPKCLS